MALSRYELIHWKDYPNLSTPLAQALLNHMDEAIKDNRGEIIKLDEDTLNIQNQLNRAVDDINTHENKLRTIQRDISTTYLELGEIFTRLNKMPESSEVYVGDSYPEDWEDLKIIVDTDEIYMEIPDEPFVSQVVLAKQGPPKDLPVIRFGIDENGNFGYYKAGADTVTPFSSGGGFLISENIIYNKTTICEKIIAIKEA